MPQPVISRQVDVWVGGDGEETKFEDLSDSHLYNIMALLNRGWERENPQRSKLVSLEKELLKRLAKMHPNVVQCKK